MEEESFDYGLDPGESFEPFDVSDIDRSQPHIMTVLGPIHPGALGPVNLAASFVPRQPTVNAGSIVTEIQEAAAVGLNGLVDLRPIGSAFEASAALSLAQHVEIHLIVSTGIQEDRSLVDNVKRIARESESGLHGTSVLPGAIVTSTRSALVSAGLSAAEATGLPLIVDARRATHSVDFLNADVIIATRSEQADDLLGRGIRVIIDLAEAGSNVARASRIQHLNNPSLVTLGYDPESIGAGRFSRWSWLIEEFPIHLLEAGLDPFKVRALMIDQPADWLTVHIPTPRRC